jgi:hypothetical protein
MIEILKLLIQCVALTVVHNTERRDALLEEIAASHLGDVARVGSRIFLTARGVEKMLARTGARPSYIVLKEKQQIVWYVVHGDQYTSARESYAFMKYETADKRARRRAALKMFDRLNIQVGLLQRR